MKIPGGYIIVIEGVDAAGKGTQSRMLYEQLSKKRIKVARMAFPDYETPIGKEIRAFLSGKRVYPAELQHLLFAANRWEKLEEILSHLSAGKVIIIDRYTESNLAYGLANGLRAGWLANLEKGLPASNLVLVLDAPVRSLASRRPDTTKDSYERSSTLQGKAKNAYRELARKHGWKLVEANESVEAVQAALLAAVREALKRDRGVSV